MFTVELKSGIENLVVEFARTDGAGGAKWPDPASLRTVITTKGGEELIVPIADAKVLGDVHETLRLGDCKVVAVIHIGTLDEMHALADSRAGRTVQPREDHPGLRAILELIDTRFEHCTTAHDVLRGIEAIVRSEIGKRAELVKKEAVDIPNDPPFSDHTRIAHAALLSVRRIIDGSKATLVERVDQIYTRTCRAMLDMGLIVEDGGVAALKAEVVALKAEVERCHERLEIVETYDGETGEPKPIPYEKRRSATDGITARDITIALLKRDIEKLKEGASKPASVTLQVDGEVVSTAIAKSIEDRTVKIRSASPLDITSAALRSYLAEIALYPDRLRVVMKRELIDAVFTALIEARSVIDCGTMCTNTDIERVCLKCLRNAVHDSNMKLAPDDAPTKPAKQNLGDITRDDLEVLVQMRESMSRTHRHHLPEARALDRIIEIVKSHGRPHSESK